MFLIQFMLQTESFLSQGPYLEISEGAPLKNENRQNGSLSAGVASASSLHYASLRGLHLTLFPQECRLFCRFSRITLSRNTIQVYIFLK